MNETFINETQNNEIVLNSTSSVCVELNERKHVEQCLDLQHNQLYRIGIRAKNRLGESLNETSIELQTSDVPVTREGPSTKLLPLRHAHTLSLSFVAELPFIESASIHLTEKFLDYRLNNESFLGLKIPLCLHIEIVNQTNRCERIVTSSGVIPLAEIDPLMIVNVSICLNGYEEFCGESLPVDLSAYRMGEVKADRSRLTCLEREVSVNWLFILIAAILIVFLLILCALCLFCLVQNCKRRRRSAHQSKSNERSTVMVYCSSSISSSAPHSPIVIEPISR